MGARPDRVRALSFLRNVMVDQKALRFIGLLFGIVTIAVTTVAATLTGTAADQVQIASEFNSPKRAQ